MKNLMKSVKNLKISALFSLLFAAILTAYLSGCSENTTSPEETDDQFIESVVKNGYSTSREDDDLMSNEINDMEDGPVPDFGNDTPIDSLMRWGRKITSVNISVTISNQGDTVKNVTINRTINGNYIIIGMVSGQQDTIVKPYVETTRRLAEFKRIARTPRPRLNWRLYQVTMLDGQTTQPQVGTDYVEMNKVEVYVNGTLSYTFLGPDFTQNVFTTKFFGGNGIPEVNRGDQVKVDVYTFSTQPEADIVAFHWARNTFGFHREPFNMISNVPNGNGWDRVYEKTFTVYPNHLTGRFNSYISASTRKSLYDDSPSEFASDLVGTPYRVKQ
jgi:hypothetical protein